MDDKNCDTELLENTLQQLDIVNRIISRYYHLLKIFIVNDAVRKRRSAISIIDLGAGGCKTAFWLQKQCNKHNILTTIRCIDSDPRAINYAKNTNLQNDHIQLIESDATEYLKNCEDVNYIISCHFLHHLPSNSIPVLLDIVNNRATDDFFIFDLKRSALSFYLFYVVSKFFFRKSFIHRDGIISIKKAFTPNDLQFLAAQCPHQNFKIMTHFPGHLSISKRISSS
jgi:SAM-dependent methyltransferase